MLACSVSDCVRQGLKPAARHVQGKAEVARLVKQRRGKRQHAVAAKPADKPPVVEDRGPGALVTPEEYRAGQCREQARLARAARRGPRGRRSEDIASPKCGFARCSPPGR